ncbi:ProP effector [Pigmentiphaga humi]|uniref:ProP effector n=1 Tax=Pigmentiphaga humi TaxID=2478468 RepID=A0A3P4B7E2_9BURK|nr:ProQ/FinO family protein [Pigmentiphaga humi]VCU71861.1 ProP effector [Pigmentiphaga humi]
MGFEALAALKQQLAEQKKQQTRAPRKPPSRPRAAAQPAVDPVVVAISRLQRHFPGVFPKHPAPKLPLKIGIFDDLKQNAAHGLDAEILKQALAAWCQGKRYWSCLTEGSARVDLAGAPSGTVTAAEAQRARMLARRQQRQTKKPAKTPSPANAGDAPSSEPGDAS